MRILGAPFAIGLIQAGESAGDASAGDAAAGDAGDGSDLVEHHRRKPGGKWFPMGFVNEHHARHSWW